MKNFVTLREAEKFAEKKINKKIFNWLQSGAEDNYTYEKNFQDLRKIQIKPLHLNKIQLRKLYRCAEDIWNYRAQHLTLEIKKKHIPNMDAFKISVSNFLKINNINNMRKIILNEFYKFITEGETINERKTGAMWMLTALVEVSSEAFNAMPWLLQ